MLVLLSLCLGFFTDSGAHNQTRYIMGTLFSLEVPAATDRLVVDRCFQIASHLDQLATTYDANSPLALLAAADQHFWTVSEDQRSELLGYLDRALAYYSETGGAFHPATGQRPFANQPAMLDALQQARSGGLVPMGWDLGGMLKGTAIDLMIDYLRSEQVPWALVNGGGDLRWYGKAQKILVRVPGDGPDDKPLFWVTAAAGALATSANDRRFITNPDGNLVGHIQFSVASRGEPVRQVSVFADTAEKADVWATALFVLGWDSSEDSLSQVAIRQRALLVAFLREDQLLFHGDNDQQIFLMPK